MRARIVRIGNSRGIRIPKAVLEQTGLRGEVELSVLAGTVVIRPAAAHPRAGWEAAFAEMAARGDDQLLDGGTPIEHSFDSEEWEWS